jgi:hypothetical protein
VCNQPCSHLRGQLSSDLGNLVSIYYLSSRLGRQLVSTLRSKLHHDPGIKLLSQPDRRPQLYSESISQLCDQVSIRWDCQQYQ